MIHHNQRKASILNFEEFCSENFDKSKIMNENKIF